MTGRHDLAAIRTIARLQAARVEAARADVDAAQLALYDAGERRNLRDAECAEALACWHDSLAMRRPDPQRLALVGDWVVARESTSTAARLDEAMAGRHRDAMARTCAEKMALRDVAVELRDQLHRRADRARDERAAQTAGELHLTKRRPT